MPRFARFLEPPSTNDIRGSKWCNTAEFPLHLKNVPHIDLGKLRRLEVHDQELRAYALEQLRWIDDEELYKPIYAKYTADPNPRTGCFHLPIKELPLLEKNRLIPHEDNIFMPVRLSGKPEHHGTPKQRRRVIEEPIANDYIDELPYFRSGIKGKIRNNMAKHKYILAYDFASYYDQFAMSDNVSRYLGVEAGGKRWRLRNLPMGFRPSCATAQSATWILTGFQRPATVDLDTVIDNVVFTADDIETLEQVGAEFEARCALVDATLNDAERTTRERITQREEFAGEAYDTSAKTRALSEKSRLKAILCKGVTDSWTAGLPTTYRQLAAVMGFVFYALEVLDIDSLALREAVKRYAKTLAVIGITRCDWNTVILQPFEPRELVQLHDVLEAITANRPVPTVTDAGETNAPAEMTIYTDASAYGWGAVVIHTANRSVHYYGAPWTADDWSRGNLHSSVTAEPLAILRACAAALTATVAVVDVATDHLPLVVMGERGRHAFIRCERYNDCLQQLRRSYPSTTIRLRYIPGQQNPADTTSRGGKDAPDTVNLPRPITAPSSSCASRRGVIRHWMC